ncbi:hypothetical protein GTZ99_02320 [Novosphingobium sp. FSY-8]|uniref:Uncharacterized protein n=1 Tax=Novosphingobium ovatum TaxID=1908523 RepID=A0ABW9XA29_9SPHN|nr:hypothetical protein [Novosphingobium ovatum]NBC35388.1 hypothetical protein [Novosphingobium ovatum]
MIGIRILDGADPRPYIASTMLRLMLSLLALISGLTVSGPDADARAFSARGAEISAMWQDAGAARVSAHVVAHAAEVTRPAQPLMMALSVPMRAVPRVDTVHLRVDRARE